MLPSARHLEQTLHEEIPLARAIGVRLADYDGKRLVLGAPLTPNLNHKRTAFGGSLYSLCVLCGWGLIHLKLEEAGMACHIVIQQADIEYLLPIAEDLQAVCTMDDAAMRRFIAVLQKRGRARLTLEVAVTRNGQPAVKFSGRYVAHE